MFSACGLPSPVSANFSGIVLYTIFLSFIFLSRKYSLISCDFFTKDNHDNFDEINGFND